MGDGPYHAPTQAEKDAAAKAKYAADHDPHRNTNHKSNDKPADSGINSTVPTDQTDPTQAYPGVAAETPPTVPTHDAGGGQGNTKVDTVAIKSFASNMDPLADSLKKSYAEITALKPVAAGAFPSAVAIRNGVSKLQEETGTALNNMVEAIESLKIAMTKMAADYDSTSEANKMTSDQLSKYMTDVNSAISASGTSGA